MDVKKYLKKIEDTRKKHGNCNPSFGDIVYHVRDFNILHDDNPIQVFICDKYVRLCTQRTNFEIFKHYVNALDKFLNDLLFLKQSAFNVDYVDEGCVFSEKLAKRRKLNKFEIVWMRIKNENL